MRQWELIGITDGDPYWTPPAKTEPDPDPEPLEIEEGGNVFFWATDLGLRMRSVSDAAAAALGLPKRWCEGRDLLDVFGLSGPNLAVLEAHADALNDRPGTFTLRGERGTIRCCVAPSHGVDGRVAGTFCIATAEPGDEDLEAAMDRVRVA
jgi:hypothetical protein